MNKKNKKKISRKKNEPGKKKNTFLENFRKKLKLSKKKFQIEKTKINSIWNISNKQKNKKIKQAIQKSKNSVKKASETGSKTSWGEQNGIKFQRSGHDSYIGMGSGMETLKMALRGSFNFF